MAKKLHEYRPEERVAGLATYGAYRNAKHEQGQPVLESWFELTAEDKVAWIEVMLYCKTQR